MATLGSRMSAGVNIWPDLSGFGRQLAAGVARVTKTMHPSVTVTAQLNSKAASLGIDEMKAKLAALAARRTDLTINLKDKQAVLEAAKIDATLARLSKKVSSPRIDLAGAASAQAQIAALDISLDNLSRKTATPSIGRRLAGLIPGISGGGGGGGGGGGLGIPLQGLTGGIPLGGPGGLAAVTAGLAALPFIAQAAAGSITFALGGALAAVGVIGASKSAEVQQAFKTMASRVSDDLQAIGTSFQPVLENIAGTIQQTFDSLVPVLSAAMAKLAGPLQGFADAFITAFAQPAVKKSITDVAGAFAKLLTALTPGLAGNIRDIASGISKIAGAVSANPKAFSDFIGFLFATVGGALTAIAWLTKVATYVEQHFVPAFKRARHDVAHWWDDMTNDIAKAWDITSERIGIVWDQIKLNFIDNIRSIVGLLAKLPGPLGAPFRKWRDDLGGVSKNIRDDIHQRMGQIQQDINSIHGKAFTIKMEADGYVKITEGKSTYQISQGAWFSPHAAGGFISGGKPGHDSVPAMLMPGEVVVPTNMVRRGAVDHLRGLLPGFAKGGLAGGPWTWGDQAVSQVQARAQKDTRAALQSAEALGVKAAIKLALASGLNGQGSAIVSYARSFLGKIPYVFGGNSLSGGLDCSAFVQQIYGKFGIHAPRTSEAQYGWASKSPPVPGGLAFYVSPAGGPPPGHVAIVQNGNSVISQGGGMGPQIQSLGFLPLMGTGVPRGGFPGSAGGGNAAIAGAASGSVQAIARALLKQYGWGNLWPQYSALENSEDATWSLTAKNPGSNAYGLAQFINGPGEYFQYGGNPNTALGQLTAQFNYIASRYGNPARAWAFHRAHGYYGLGGAVADRGTVLSPGLNLRWNNTGKPEQLVPPGSSGVHLHLTVNGPVGSQQQLEDWYVKTANRMARTGRLTQAVQRASRG